MGSVAVAQMAVGVARDWLEFRKYKRAQRAASKRPAGDEDSTSSIGLRTHLIGAIVMAVLVLILLLVLFSCTVASDPSSHDPGPPPLVGEEPQGGPGPSVLPAPPPDLDLESAYRGGYFIDPVTHKRYLVAQIDVAAKPPSDWFCKRLSGLPTRRCLVGMTVSDKDEPAVSSGERPAEAPVPQSDEPTNPESTALAAPEGEEETNPAPNEASDEKEDSGEPWWAVFAGLGGGVGGFAGGAALVWQVAKDRDEFRDWRGLPRRKRRELIDGVTVLFSSPVDPEVADAPPRRPSVEGNDLSAPL